MQDLYSLDTRGLQPVRTLREQFNDTVNPEDDHRRTANDVEQDRLIAARRTLLLRFLPFVRLEDQNLPPAVLLETVAGRLQAEARTIRSKMYGRAPTVEPEAVNTDYAYDCHATV